MYPLSRMKWSSTYGETHRPKLCHDMKLAELNVSPNMQNMLRRHVSEELHPCESLKTRIKIISFLEGINLDCVKYPESCL